MALTRTTTEQQRLPLQIPAARAFEVVQRSMSSVGKVKDANATFGRIVGFVKAGALNMNRADMTVVVEPSGDASVMNITVTAQEGLKSQGTTGGAISRLLKEIEKQMG